jgi:hypothetical protein
MADELLSTAEAARRLGISRASLYAWLGESDVGSFQLRGQPVTIQYFQSGARGQGRIRIEAGEVERLREMMRVKPSPQLLRRPPVQQTHFPGIKVKLGYPRE